MAADEIVSFASKEEVLLAIEQQVDDGFAKGQLIEDRGLDEELDARLSDVFVHDTSNNVSSDVERERRLASVSVFVHSSTEGSDSLDRVEGASFVEGGRDGPPSSVTILCGGLNKKRNSFHISHSSRKFPGRRWKRWSEKTWSNLNQWLPIIDSFSRVAVVINVVFALFVIYSMFSMVFQIGFDVNPWGAWFVVECCVDFAFWVDIAASFRTSIWKDGGTCSVHILAVSRPGSAYQTLPSHLRDPSLIAWHYLSSSFAVDAISSLPFTLLFSQTSLSNKKLWYLKFLLLVKLLRWPRLARSVEELPHQIRSQNALDAINVTVTMLMVLFYSHLSACVFFFVGRHEDEGQSWLAAYMWNDEGESRALTEAPVEIQYLAALYFSVVSVTSLGYGDIHPTDTAEERVFAVFNGFGSAIILGYVIGRVTNLLFFRSTRNAALRERFDMLQHYIVEEDLPLGLASQMLQLLTRKWEKELLKYTLESLLEDIPNHLLIDLRVEWWRKHVAEHPLFPHDPTFLAALLHRSTSRMMAEQGRLCEEGHTSRHLYVVRRGEMELTQRERPGGKVKVKVKGEGEGEAEAEGGLEVALDSPSHHESGFYPRENSTATQDKQSGRRAVGKRGSVGQIVGGDEVVQAIRERERKEGPHWEKHQHKLTAVSMEYTAEAKSEMLVFCFLISDIIEVLSEVHLLNASDVE